MRSFKSKLKEARARRAKALARGDRDTVAGWDKAIARLQSGGHVGKWSEKKARLETARYLRKQAKLWTASAVADERRRRRHG